MQLAIPITFQGISYGDGETGRINSYWVLIEIYLEASLINDNCTRKKWKLISFSPFPEVS